MAPKESRPPLRLVLGIAERPRLVLAIDPGYASGEGAAIVLAQLVAPCTVPTSSCSQGAPCSAEIIDPRRQRPVLDFGHFVDPRSSGRK